MSSNDGEYPDLFVSFYTTIVKAPKDLVHPNIV